MDSIKEKKNLVKSSEMAIRQYDKLIKQDIDLEELDPEKAKAAAQGKMEAIKAYRETLTIIGELSLEIEQEQNARDGKEQESSFTSVENMAKKK